MKAIGYARHGDVTVLEQIEVPKPNVGRGEVLVRVRAVGLNPLDYRLRKGELRFLTGLRMPRYVASDFAGTIVEVGRGVQGYSAGDDVFGMASQVVNGCSAQFISISQHQIAHMPTSLSFESAAAVPLASLTAYQALLHIADLKREHHVLINGASGGVGTFATQIAHQKGAMVTGVTSYRNVEMVSALGAQRIVDYTQRRFVDDATHYDVIFDCYGNQRFEKVASVLAPHGRYISTIPAWSRYRSVLANPIRSKKSNVVVVRARGTHLAAIAEMIDSGDVKPVVEHVFEPEQFREAYVHLESKRTKGKLTLKIE